MAANVEAIKAAIEALSETDYVALRQWFSEKDWENWTGRSRRTQNRASWVF